MLGAIGFKPGVASPCCFYRERDGTSCVVHGDGFTFEGLDENIKGFPDDLRNHWLVKVRAILGPDSGDDKEVTILG